jgi:hypothetical protein
MNKFLERALPEAIENTLAAKHAQAAVHPVL